MENDDVRAGVGILRLKKNGLRESLEEFRDRANSLLLSVHWKDLEDHYEAMQQTIERRAEELRLREEAIKNGLRELEERVSFIETKRSEFDLLWEAMDAKFRGLESIVARAEEIWVKEEEFESASGQVMESIKAKWKEIEAMEKELKSKEVEIERKNKKVYECAVVVKTDKYKLNEELKSLGLREKQFKERVREVELRNLEFESDREKLDKFAKQLEAKDIETAERLKEVESRNKDLEDKRKELEWIKQRYEADQKKLGERIGKIDCDEMRISSEIIELESKKRKFCVDRNKLDERLLEMEGQCRKLEIDKKKFEVDRKKLDEELREFELKSKKLDDNMKAVELSKKELETQFEQGKVRKEIELKSKTSEEVSKDGNNSCCLAINGPTLQIFLNECWKDQEKIGFAVCVLLSLSSDPAKLVLDAVKSFFPPHLKKGDVEFSGTIVRRSCIFLLEQLMGMCTKVNPTVKIEAKKLSLDWIKKVKGDGEQHTSEILGFLLLLAVYDLGSSFSVDELSNYAKIVAHCRQVPHICRLLGMANKIPGLIEDLIKGNRKTLAIRYVMEFNLVEKFSPNLLLKDHMETSEIVFNTAIKSGNESLEAQIKTIDKRISDLKDVIRCIESYKIASGYSLANLRHMVASLENQKVHLRKEAVHRVESNILPYTIGTVRANSSPNTSSSVQSVYMDCHHHRDLSLQDPLLKTEDLSHDKDTSLDFVKLEKESLDTSTNKYVDSNSEQLKVAIILEASHNPARYVLLAVEEFLQSNKCGHEILLLLKELKKLPYEVDPSTVVEARKPAAAWKSKMALKHPDVMEVSSFLIFLDVYRLISNLGEDEILTLFDPKQLRAYFEQIGMPEFLPDLVQKLINSNYRIKAIRYIHALDLSERFPIVTLLDEHLKYWKNQEEYTCKGPNPNHHLQMGALNRRLAAIISAIKLIKECKLEAKYPVEGLEEAVADVRGKLKLLKNQVRNGQTASSTSTIEDVEVDQQPSGHKRKACEPINMGPSYSNLKNQKWESWGNKRPKKFVPFKGKFRGRGGKFMNRYDGFHGQEPNHFRGGMDREFR